MLDSEPGHPAQVEDAAGRNGKLVERSEDTRLLLARLQQLGSLQHGGHLRSEQREELEMLIAKAHAAVAVDGQRSQRLVAHQ